MSRIILNVIIVSYNSEKYIDRCISSLLKDLNVSNISYLITVVDNNSSDNTLSVLKKHNEKIAIIENKENLGFANAVNTGIKFRDANNYLLINPDAFIIEGSISKLLECSEKSRGICGGKTIGIKNEIQGDHFRKPNLFVGIFDFTNLAKLDSLNIWHNYFYMKNDKVDNKNIEVDCVTGGFMMINSNVIKQIGMLDDNFFMYLEDVDFCIRAKNKGIKIYYCPKAIVKHVSGGSSDNKEKTNLSAWFESRKKYFFKNHNFVVNMIIQPIFIIDKYLINLKKKYENRTG